jgi:hypothetical protein
VAPTSHRALGEVLAGAEAAPRAGDQQRPHRSIGAHARQRVAQLDVHRRGERVELVGPVERDGGDALADIE